MDTCESLQPELRDPFALSLQEWLRTDGMNVMTAMLRLYAGEQTKPSIANADNPRDGIFFPSDEQLAVVLNGLIRALFEVDGFSFVVGRFFGKLTHANTADRIWTFPDFSGEVLVNVYSTEGETVTVSVGTSAVQLLTEDLSRVGGLITNNGSQIVYLGFSDAVVAGDVAAANGGLRVNPNGGSFSLAMLAGYKGELWGITKTSTSIVGAATW